MKATTEYTQKMLDELEAIRAKHGGVLKPERVVAHAKNPKSALHARFTWDDTEAAHQWRLEEARYLIRVCVNVLPNTNEPVQAYVSLVDDRGTNGYRALVDVMGDANLRGKFLEQARIEATAFQKKYRQITELVPVFEAMDRVFAKPRKAATAHAVAVSA